MYTFEDDGGEVSGLEVLGQYLLQAERCDSQSCGNDGQSGVASQHSGWSLIEV